MTAKCTNCGADVELGSALRERRQVLCPACGAVVVRGIPAKDAKTTPPAETGTGTAKYPDWALSEQPEAPAKKKLAVIRPAKRESKAQKEYGGLYDAEKRAKMYDQIKHRLWIRKFLKNFFEIFVLLGTLFSMWFIYKAWDSHLEHKRELAAAERAASDAREAEKARLRREEQERQKAQAEAARAAAKAENERQEQARRLAEQERRDTAEAYKMFTYALKENEFDMYTDSVTNRLAGAEGELCYLLPDIETVPVLYWAVSNTNGEIKVSRINENGNKESLGASAFFERIAKLDYLVAGDGKVYYHANRKNPLWGRLSKTQSCDPAKVFFGGLHEKLKSLNPTYDEIRFEIVFVPKNSQKQIVCETLEFGCEYSLDMVREAVEQAFPLKGYIGGSFNAKKFKRTVKFWNGSVIKQGVDGITYVPRTMPRKSTVTISENLAYSSRVIYRSRVKQYNDWERWQSLYEQAVREDEAEAAYYRQQKADFETHRQKAASATERAYIDRIDKIIRGGELYYHAKKRKAK